MDLPLAYLSDGKNGNYNSPMHTNVYPSVSYLSIMRHRPRGYEGPARDRPQNVVAARLRAGQYKGAIGAHCPYLCITASPGFGPPTRLGLA